MPVLTATCELRPQRVTLNACLLIYSQLSLWRCRLIQIFRQGDVFFSPDFVLLNVTVYKIYVD